MYTPGVTRHRRNLRQAINDAFPKIKPEEVFERIKKPKAQFIEMFDLEPYCEKANCPAAVLENVFAPYGSKNVVITQSQWVTFMNDDFTVDFQNCQLSAEPMNQRQTFILRKFVEGMQTKFGYKMSQKWAKALQFNPPEVLNTTLKITALCRLYENMNLPFPTADFIDTLFLFYGDRVEELSKDQFSELFSAFQ